MKPMTEPTMIFSAMITAAMRTSQATAFLPRSPKVLRRVLHGQQSLPGVSSAYHESGSAARRAGARGRAAEERDQSYARFTGRSARRARPRGPRAGGGRGGSGGPRRRRGRRAGRRRDEDEPAGGGGGGGGGHDEHDRAAARPRHGPPARLPAAGSTSGRVRRPRARRRARAHRGRQPAAHPPRRAAERQVGDRREAGLVLAQGEQEMGGAVRGRQVAVDLHAPAVDPPPAGAHEQRARLPDEPDAERAALQREPRAGVQLARVVAEQVAEQAERRALRRRRRRAAAGARRSRRGSRTAPGSPRRARSRSPRPGTTAARARASARRWRGTGSCGRAC